ncbi:T9SS type A sorting domain-containing protein [bacterium]|nr:T9SS type A sorting domain-containing protein [bacterium]
MVTVGDVVFDSPGTVSFILPIDPQASLVTVEPSSLLVGGETTITISVKDGSGKPVPDIPYQDFKISAFIVKDGDMDGTLDNGAITFSPEAKTDVNGVITARFISESAGDKLIRVTLKDVELEAQPIVTFTLPITINPVRSRVTVDPSTLWTGKETTITIELKDDEGDPVPDIENQDMSITAYIVKDGATNGIRDNGTIIFSPGAKTDTNGVITATYKSDTPGEKEIMVTVKGVVLGSPPRVKFIPPAAIDPARSLVTVIPSTLWTGEETEIKIELKDNEGNPIPDIGSQDIRITAYVVKDGATSGTLDSGIATFTPGAKTDANGAITVTYKSDTPGEKEIVVTVKDTVLINPPRVTFTLPVTIDPSQSRVSVNPVSLMTGEETTITIELKDSVGNPIPDIGSQFVSITTYILKDGTSNGIKDEGTVTYLTTATDVKGVITATYKSDAAGEKEIVVSVKDIVLGNAPRVIFTSPVIVDPARSHVTVAPDSVQAGENATVTISLTGSDGNPFIGASPDSIIITITGPDMESIELKSASTDSTSIFSASLTSKTAGEKTITVTVNGTALDDHPVIVFTPVPADPEKSLVEIKPASLPIGAEATITMTLRYSDDNPVPDIKPDDIKITAYVLKDGKTDGGEESIDFRFAPDAVTDDSGVITAGFTSNIPGEKIMTVAIKDTFLKARPTVTFIPLPDSATSAIAVKDDSLMVGTSATVTLTLLDTEGKPLAGLSNEYISVFVDSLELDKSSFSALKTDENGTIQISFTSINPGERTIKVVIVSTELNIPAKVKFTAYPVDAQKSTFGASPDPRFVGQTATLSIKLLDSGGKPIPGIPKTIITPTLINSDGQPEIVDFNFTDEISDNDGLIAAQFTCLTPGKKTIKIWVSDTELRNDPTPTITFMQYEVASDSSRIAINPEPLVAGEKATITLTVNNKEGKPIEGISRQVIIISIDGEQPEVTFSAVTTDVNGKIDAVFIPTESGTKTLAVTVSGILMESRAVICKPGKVDPEKSTVAVAPDILTVDETAALTITLKDRYENPIPDISNTAINISLFLKDGVTQKTFSSSITDSTGLISATFTSTKSMIHSITVTADGVVLTNTPVITFKPGTINTDSSLVVISTPEMTVDDELGITVRIADKYNNPISDIPANSLELLVNGLVTEFTTGQGTTDEKGEILLKLLHTKPGLLNIIVRMKAGETLTKTPITVTFVHGAIDVIKSQVLVDPKILKVNERATITIMLKDQHENPIPDIAQGDIDIQKFIMRDGTTGAQFTTGATNSDGIIIATFTTHRAGMTHVPVKIKGKELISTIDVIFNPDSPDSASSDVALSHSVRTIRKEVILTLTLKDQYENPIPDLTPGHISINAYKLKDGTTSDGFNTIGFTQSLTDSSGTIKTDSSGIIEAKFTSTDIGEAVVMITIDGQIRLKTQPSIIFRPEISPVRSGLEVTAQSVDDSLLVSIVLRDENRNPIEYVNGNEIKISINDTEWENVRFDKERTGQDGRIQAYLKYIQSEKIMINVLADDVPLTEKEMTLLPGNVSADSSSVAISPDSLRVDSPVTLTISLRDQYGNPIPDVSKDDIDISGFSEDYKIKEGITQSEFMGSVTNAGGTILAEFSSTKSGLKKMTVSAKNSRLSGSIKKALKETVSVVFNPGYVDSLMSSFTVDSQRANLGDSLTVTVVLKDKYGNPIPEMEVTFPDMPLYFNVRPTISAARVFTDGNGHAVTVLSCQSKYNGSIHAQYTEENTLKELRLPDTDGLDISFESFKPVAEFPTKQIMPVSSDNPYTVKVIVKNIITDVTNSQFAVVLHYWKPGGETKPDTTIMRYITDDAEWSVDTSYESLKKPESGQVQTEMKSGSAGSEKPAKDIEYRFRTEIPQTSIDVGLRYYVTVHDPHPQLEDGVSDTLSIMVKKNEFSVKNTKDSAHPNGIVNNRWTIFSVPAVLDQETQIKNLLSGQLGLLGNTKKDHTWFYGTYTPDGKKIEPTETVYDHYFAPGKAYFLFQRVGTEPTKADPKIGENISVNLPAGHTVVESDEYKTTLDTGWYLIGNPYEYTVPLHKLITTGSGELIPDKLQAYQWNEQYRKETEAKDEGKAAVTGWDKDVLKGQTALGILVKPWGGILVHYSSEASSDTASVIAAKPATIEEALSGGWGSRISVYSGFHMDANNYLGVIPQDSESWNFLEPPQVGTLGSLYFEEETSGYGDMRYCTSFREPGQEGYSWDMCYQSPGGKETVNLSWELKNDANADIHYAMVDISRGTVIRMDEDEIYEFRSFDKEYTYGFKVFAGSENYVNQYVEELLASLPKAFELQQNFPNPFNPSTTITFTLPVASPVSLKIYNLLGQEVNTLINNAVFAPGNHAVIWNGKDSEGRQASSGIYIYQMRTQDYVKSRKMLVVK